MYFTNHLLTDEIDTYMIEGWVLIDKFCSLDSNLLGRQYYDVQHRQVVMVETSAFSGRLS